MPIQVVCPNGHKLKVKDSNAGKTGRCPICKAMVHVPQPATDGLSEDAIMSILGPSDARDFRQPEGGPSIKPPPASPPKKCCANCNQLISAEVHICPYCHTYIAALRDF